MHVFKHFYRHNAVKFFVNVERIHVTGDDIQILNPALLSLALGPALLKMPLLLRCFIQVAILIPSMSYIVMPTMTRLFAQWLYPKEPER